MVMIRQETQEFLNTLHQYLQCRQVLDDLYETVDSDHTLAQVILSTDSNGIQTGGNERYKARYQQQSVQGKVVSNLNQLYHAATKAQSVFENLIQQMVQDIGDTEDGDTIQLKMATLKSKERAMEKAKDDYSQRNPLPSISWLHDIVRASVIFHSTDQIIACIHWLQDNSQIHIVKAKNRFATPDLTGYRDMNYHVQIVVPTKQNSFQYVCELQIHHGEMKRVEKELDSHQYYEYFRTYFAGSKDTLTERLDDLKLIGQGQNITSPFIHDLLTNCTDAERLQRLGDLFCHQVSEYDLAYKLYKRCLELRQLQSDYYSTDKQYHITLCYNNMAQVLNYQGKYDEAMKLLEGRVDNDDSSNKKDTTEYADSYNNMAVLLKNQGKYEEALRLYQQALDIYIQSLGKDHPTISDCYNNMAIVYKNQGKYDQALQLYQKALEIRKNSLGVNHSAVSDSYNNMANVLKSQKKYQEAYQLYERALEIRKRSLGNDHPTIGDSYNNMAVVLTNQGKYKAALKYCQQALELHQRSLEKDHPTIGHSYKTMANIWYGQKKYHQALQYYQQALQIYKKSLGNDHPSVGDCYNNMAMVYKNQGNYQQAMKLNKEAIEILQNSYGPHHPRVGDSLVNMASILANQGNYSEAIQYYQKAFYIRRRLLGTNHPDVIDLQQKIQSMSSSSNPPPSAAATTTNKPFPFLRGGRIGRKSS